MRVAGAFRGGRAAKRGAGGVVAAAAGGSAPTITSITPSSGAAGTAVVVIGTNFIAGATCTVGGVSITPSVINSTRIEGTTGAHVDGLVDVVVTTANGSDTETLYTYSAAVAPLFKSDWSTAPGSGDSALRDTGKGLPWASTQNSASTDLAVISSSGLGFPATMTNVLEHTFNPAASGNGRAAFVILPQGSIAAPGIGTTQFLRYYFRADYGAINDQGGSHHPVENEQGTSGSVLWNWHPGGSGDGTYPIRFYWDSPGTSPTNWHAPNTNGSTHLTLGVVYRLEWAITRTGTSTYSIKCRFYGADDSTLLYPDTNGTETKMVNSTGASTMLLEGAVFTGNVNILTGVRLGNNGWGVAVHGTEKDYFGGFCIRSDDWCGAYNASTG